MAEVTIYHNPNCSSSRHAVSAAEEAGVPVDIVKYLSTPPDDATLRSIVGKLDDPVTDLVRRDKRFDERGLDDADVATADQVVDVLVDDPRLLQRPLIVTADRAFIGRPKDRATEFFSARS